MSIKTIVKVISLSTLLLGVATSAMAASQSTSKIWRNMDSKTLTYTCITTKSNFRACGYFQKNVLQKLYKSAKSDVQCNNGTGGFVWNVC